MTRLLEWCLGLDQIRLGRDEPLSVQWQLPVAPWILAGIGLLTVFVVFLLYLGQKETRKQAGRGWRRIFLFGIRVGLFALVLAALCRPTLVLQQNRTEQAHVAILVDHSRSMARRETYADKALGRSVAAGAGLAGPSSLGEKSRLDLVRGALLSSEASALHALAQNNSIQLYTFAAAASSLTPAVSGGSDEGTKRRSDEGGKGRWDEGSGFDSFDELIKQLSAIEPDGAETNLVAALRGVAQDARGRRLAAIVLVSDGRSTGSVELYQPDGSSMAQGSSKSNFAVPVYALRIGSPAPVRDVRVGPVLAQESVFVNDILVVRAHIEAVGLSEPTPVTVRLVDERSGLTVDSITLVLSPADSQPESSQADEGHPGLDEAGMVELLTTPTRAGSVRYRVAVSALPNERTIENNADTVEVTVLDDKLSVLYVDGYPRYEYRYLKNALVREASVKVSVLLLEADERFVQEGTETISGTEAIRRFPESAQELSRYDVVLLGDVDPRGQWLSNAQMEMLVDFVGRDGGGLGVIAGERYAPQRFRGTPLEKLLPIRIDPDSSGSYASTIVHGFAPRLTADGLTSRLLRLFDDAQADRSSGAADARRRLFDTLPKLYWFAKTLGPKPGATVLLEHPTTDVPAQPTVGNMPLLVLARYGAGKILFQATDDTWRWRREGGEFLHDTYWVRLVRELMPLRRKGRDQRLVIRTDRREYAFGQRVRAQVEVLDSQLLAEQGNTLRVLLTDREDSAVMRFSALRLGDDSVVFEGSCVPPRIGGFTLSVEGVTPRLGDKPAVARIEVAPTDPESVHLEADHHALERIAAATGGRMVALDKLDEALGAIKDRSVQIPDDIREPLWDSKLVMLLFGILITTEWVMRKSFGML